MNKTAVLAGISATLAVLLVDAVVKNRRLTKYVDEVVQSNNYNAQLATSWKTRNKVRQQEVMVLWNDLDDIDQEEFRKFVNQNEEYLDIVAPFPNGSM